jgi:hypothetical protein
MLVADIAGIRSLFAAYSTPYPTANESFPRVMDIGPQFAFSLIFH